eukprot:5762132-Pyramimonas_sp.AAC.1
MLPDRAPLSSQAHQALIGGSPLPQILARLARPDDGASDGAANSRQHCRHRRGHKGQPEAWKTPNI